MTEVNAALIEKARSNVLRIADYLERKKLTPSFYMLTVGMPYRKEVQFNKLAEERNLERGAQGFNELKEEFNSTYDMYSGENLIAVASHQSKRETVVNFPEENTPAYEALLKIMERFGKRLKELIELEGQGSVDKLALEHFKRKIRV